MSFVEILEDAVNKKVSDIFIIAGRPISYSLNGSIVKYDEKMLMPDDTEKIIREIYELSNQRSIDSFLNNYDDDFSFAVSGLSRFRANIFMQRNSMAAVIRVISFRLPDSHILSIPETILNFAHKKKGLVVVTGSAGSGKSTTLACIINQINLTENKHIITLEDPIEFIHRHNKSIVTQREIGNDVKDYVSGLRASLRQKPDVILLGEMRDYQTIDTAMQAAETGHLVFSTLHTMGAKNSIERIIDAFPANEQGQVAIQLSLILEAVVCQQLVPAKDGGLIPAFEIMNLNPAIRNLIREKKIHQIDNVISTSKSEDMISMDTYLWNLWKADKITRETMLTYALNPDLLANRR